uniref:Septin n=1 Tax=Strigamia maritima TaxID=126957 RepID=T1IYA6_STRMM
MAQTLSSPTKNLLILPTVEKLEEGSAKETKSLTGYLNDNVNGMETETKPQFPVILETNGYVGIDTIQEQIRKRVVKQGYQFNILVVGASGLGKSTLIDTLFRSEVSRKIDNDEYKVPVTTQINTVGHVIEEKGMTLRLTITDTPGFGDNVNNDKCWIPIVEYIEAQYEKYLIEEQCIIRKKIIPDSRIHCCLYFIAPTGHSVKELDLQVMKHLDKCVNLIPIIAKADTLTLEERVSFKRRIKKDLAKHGIVVYSTHDGEREFNDAELDKKIRDMMPFAVVGSRNQYPLNNRNVLGRRTQWGLVEVENRSHCEFADLRDMLIRTHMHDLVQVTSSIFYEKFRLEQLSQTNGQSKVDESSL